MTDYTKTDPNTTQKLSANPDVTVRSTAVYPNIYGETGPNGEQNIGSQFGSLETAFTQKTDITSGYHIVENTADGKNSIQTFEHSNKFSYGSGGTSTHNDGNQASSTKGQTHNVTTGSRGVQTGKDTHEGNGGSKVGGTGGDGSFRNHTGGTEFVTTSGDHVTQHDGNVHKNLKGDQVDAVAGNKYTIVNHDYGVHVQSGNYDIKVDSGQFHANSGSDITITSSTKITFKVGQSSIVMTPQGITIIANGPNGLMLESNQSNVTIYANGGSQYVVNVQPPSVPVPGPGAPAPYTTFQS